ncbi:siroheme synthase CysG [Yoonia sp. SS1-5]|uniref:Siroheme synthase CysG n=1 Tax=Yoonia rhodophyticola TaxID=3137370 RepID=A0AAN0MDG4_9RHOB
MKTFPMFLTMAGRHVVIAGGGEQAAQKCRLMLKTEAEIRVLAPELDVELADLHRSGRILWQAAPIDTDSFADAALCFIATGCPGLDASLHALAKAAGAVVNVVDQPALCDAITPSIVDRDPVVVAIGTEGTAPVLARQIKTRMEELLEPRLGDLAALAGRLRDRAAARLQPRQRRDLWRWVFNGPARAAHKRGAERDAASMIKEAIKTGDFGQAVVAPVSLVGAGPGARDLITLRGVQRLQEADIIFYDRLVDPQVLELARRDAERVFVGKTPGAHTWPQDKINAVIVAAALQGKRVVRLKCGDPGIFARGAEELAALEDAGLAYEIVPGVTAASAAAACAGQMLTHRHATDTLVLTTGQSAVAGRVPDWVGHLREGANIAIYMGVNTAQQIENAVIAAGLGRVVEVHIVSHAQMPTQQTVSCAPTRLVETITTHGLQNPAIIFLRYPYQTQSVQAATDPPQLRVVAPV